MIRADWVAATPKCPWRRGLNGPICGRTLAWHDGPLTGTIAPDTPPIEVDGMWCCGEHGPVLAGGVAAERLGLRIAEPDPF